MAFEGDLCESMVEQGVMPPLSVMLKESVTELQRIRSCTLLEGGGGGEGGEGEEKEEGKEGEGPVDDGRREQLFEIADQGVNLLLNLRYKNITVTIRVYIYRIPRKLITKIKGFFSAHAKPCSPSLTSPNF